MLKGSLQIHTPAFVVSASLLAILIARLSTRLRGSFYSYHGYKE